MAEPDFSPSSIAAAAVEALLAEGRLAPKPGLVDPLHKGAHEDMDYPLLMASALSLETCFAACAAEGRRAALESRRGEERGAVKNVGPSFLLPRLRPIGLAGEKAMYAATGGVNCHKGSIFCLGLLGAALGWLGTDTNPQNIEPPEGRFGDRACLLVAEICHGLVEAELGRREGAATGRESAGERLFAGMGVRGARGEAEAGFPILRERILPILRAARGGGSEAIEASRLEALLASMSSLEDSCLLSRGGAEGLDYARQGALAVASRRAEGKEAWLKALLDLDRELCERRLSPGGSADLLAAGIFLVSFD